MNITNDVRATDESGQLMLALQQIDKVASGSKLVEDAGATMDEVVASVRRVTDIMGEISSATVEQSAGIDMVNQAIAQLDQATQQNAALVEEAAAAAQSLQDQACNLAQMVGVFKLDGGRAGPRRAGPGHAGPPTRPAGRGLAQRAAPPAPPRGAASVKRLALAPAPADGAN